MKDPNVLRSNFGGVEDLVPQVGSRLKGEEEGGKMADDGEGMDSIQVVVRVRPFTARETARSCKCCVEMEGNVVYLLPPYVSPNSSPHFGAP